MKNKKTIIKYNNKLMSLKYLKYKQGLCLKHQLYINTIDITRSLSLLIIYQLKQSSLSWGEAIFSEEVAMLLAIVLLCSLNLICNISSWSD